MWYDLGMKSLIELGLEQLEGWCWLEKAERMLSIALDEKAKVMVEVGVYGGRSLIPLIVAAKANGGYVWGIDAWSNAVATTVPYGEDHNSFWANDDMGRVKDKLFKFLGEHKLSGHVAIVEATGEQALHLFQDKSIDLLHVDASHSILDEARDVSSYLMKLREGGILIIDDTDRAEVQLALEVAKSVCDVVHTDPKYVVLRKTI